MPDIVRLRYTGSGPVLVTPLGRAVDPDNLVEFAGRVLTHHPPAHADADPQPVPADADYYLIESGNPPVVRAWPKSLWANETVVSKKTKE